MRYRTRGALTLVMVMPAAVYAMNLLSAVPQRGEKQSPRLPTFQVDPLWPKLPDTWLLGRCPASQSTDPITCGSCIGSEHLGRTRCYIADGYENRRVIVYEAD